MIQTYGICYSLYFFSTGHDFVTYDELNLYKMSVIIIGVVLNVVFIGHLKMKQTIATNELRRDNRTLEYASSTDHLTGIRNRFALKRNYKHYIGKDVYVLMLDVDGFKGINDRYGHSAGDLLLRAVGIALSGIFGDENCYRYGGDEFLVIKSDLSDGEFKDSVALLSGALDGAHFEGKPIEAHLSGGYTFGKLSGETDLRMMIDQADRSLLEAKREGKNRFIGYNVSRYTEVIEGSKK
ncbi:MAG: GGDEF domain-containing protein [Clostridia bacterium]|nr:GGDEF domain-containing protein [Clostridia bacterium]